MRRITKTYTSPITLTEDTWRYGTKEQKAKLLKAIGGHKSFVKTKTVPELVKRGGGLHARALLNLNRMYLKKHKNKMGEVTINWGR